MKNHHFGEKYANCIIMLLTALVNLTFLFACFDFYYDLNDDMMMKDIMAGVYTGTPDGHNMQTLYILGMLISFCYRLCRDIPWYGLFLLLCQLACLCLTGIRLLGFCKGKWEKAGCMLLVTVFLWGVLLPHMTALHYTYTSAMLAATALFYFITTPDALLPGQFIVRNIPSILLVVLAYQLRTEMLLLVFPLICLAGLFRWGEEEKIWHKKNFYRYGVVFGGILLGMLLSRGIDFAAYGSEDWKRFLVFFEKRTEVYDYHLDVVTSGEHAGDLQSIGLNDAQQELLANYNFGLDEEIDEKTLEKIAAYAAASVGAADTASGGKGMSDYVKAFRYSLSRTLHDEDAPYGRLLIFGYLSVAVIGVCNALADRGRPRKWAFIWELILLGAVRTLLWMFLLIRGRYPVRVTHSLCLAELLLLLGMLCRGIIRFRDMWERHCREEGRQDERRREKQRQTVYGRSVWRQETDTRAWTYRIVRAVGLALPSIFAFLCAMYFPTNIENTREDMVKKSLAHQSHLEVEKYCKAHPGNFYFLDVYSTVGYSQKVFRDVDNTAANYDLMGGWICKSPLYKEKLKWFGITTMEESLLTDDNVYFIVRQGEDIKWLPAYYAGKGIKAGMEQIDSVAGTYDVWKIVGPGAAGNIE